MEIPHLKGENNTTIDIVVDISHVQKDELKIQKIVSSWMISFITFAKQSSVNTFEISIWGGNTKDDGVG